MITINLESDISQSSKKTNENYISRLISIGGQQLETTPIYDAYWEFATERQRIFFRRLRGSNSPVITEDSILSQFRFTNAYRASDRVSQYLIRNVIYDTHSRSAEDTFFRIMLFKLFNKIDTWKSLEAEFGDLSVSNYDFDAFDKFLSERQARNVRNYSAAYIMPSASRKFHKIKKHSNHLKLIEWMISEKFVDRLKQSSSLKEGYELMRSAPSLGPFLAFQFITDINYSQITSSSEHDYVVAGPGALDGISKCFVDTKNVRPEVIIEHMCDSQDAEFDRLKLNFPDLWGRQLQLIDCQNLFCEISKYSRVSHPEYPGLSGRTRIKQKYRPAGPVAKPWYPPKWQLNDLINADDTLRPETFKFSDDTNQIHLDL